MKALTALFAALFLLCGCSTTLVRERPEMVEVADAKLDASALVPPLLELEGTRVHSISGSWKENAFVAQCVLKNEEGKMMVVFLAPQMRLATLRLSRPCKVEFERARSIPAAFEPEYALLDLAFVNLPVGMLASALGPAFKVEETDGRRKVFTASGKPVCEMARLEGGGLHFVNAVYGYEYDLKEEKR